MRRARSGCWWAVVVAVVLVAGCSREPPQTVGGSSVSSLAVPVAPVVPVVAPVGPTVVLAAEGVGVASFGDDADEAIAAATAALGEPDQDSGWVEPLSIGACAGTEARFVAWGSLHLYFSDQSSVGQGARHFFGYSYGRVDDIEVTPAGLATPEGIGLGTNVAFLRAAYPDVVVEAGEEGLLASSFYVDDRLSGRLTGGADDDLVTVIIGGDPCGVGL